MDHWEVFFDNEEELTRAKEHQLERVITIFPWIAPLISFSIGYMKIRIIHIEERAEKWMEILNEFSTC